MSAVFEDFPADEISLQVTDLLIFTLTEGNNVNSHLTVHAVRIESNKIEFSP